MVANENFSAWELETIFHIAMNKTHKAEGAHFEKLRLIASKALAIQSKLYPDYNHGIKKGVRN